MISGTRHIPSLGDQSLVTFTVLVNDTPLSRAVPVLRLGVDKVANRIASASLQIEDGCAAKQDFKISGKDWFVPGKRIQIKAGYQNREEIIFKGIIVKHSIQLWKSGETVLNIMAKDEAVHMIMGRKNATYTGMRDSQAFSEMADNHPVTIESEETTTVHEQLVQYQSTDWDFLICRAEANGQIVINSDNKLFIQKPKLAKTPKLSLAYGANLFEFEEEIDVRHQWGEVTANAWDMANQAPLSVEAATRPDKIGGNLPYEDLSEVIGSSRWQAYHLADLDEPELQAWADGLQLRSHYAKIKGMVCCQGTAAVLPGDTIELLGLGKRFNGLVLVSGVQHKLADGNWLTYLQIGLSVDLFQKNRADVAAPAAAGLLPPVSGMHTGIVTQLAGDPIGEDRIRVRIPVIDPTGEGLWARLATLDAGANRGSIFRPEIGDEVLVSFLNNDPRCPAIVGALHSSAHPAPLAAEDDNHQKGFISRSGMQLIFDDNKTSVELTTPSGKRFALDENAGEISLEDEHGNRVVLSESGIDLSSAQNINIQAQGEIKFQATNITAEASANFKASGNASTELTASGVVKIQGSLVQIN